jgi:hypothetical protein
MRVRRTVPQFTFSLSARFVNSLSSVSTGFFRFFSVLFENRYIFLINSKKIQVLAAKNSAINPRSHRIFALAIAVAFVFVFLVVIPAGDLLLPLSLLSSSPFSIQQKPRHLDRGCSQFHREQRSGETPHFVFAVVPVFVFLSFRFREDPPSKSNLLPSHQPLRDNQSRGIKRCRSE